MKNLRSKLLSAAAAILLSAGASYALFTTTVDRIAVSVSSIPVVSACGSGTLAAGSNDMAGEFTATGATGCTLTFGTPYATAPSCAVSEETANLATRTTATTTTTLIVAAGTSGSKYSYVCIAKSGG